MFVLALAVIAVGTAVAVYAFARSDNERRPRPRPPRWPSRIDHRISARAIDTFEEVANSWWPARKVAWGREHPEVDPPYDWQADQPPAIAGPGRGRVL